MNKTDLAIHGGPKIRNRDWPNRGQFDQDDKLAVAAVFDNSINTGEPFGYDGPPEETFCNEFASMMGGGFVDAVSSGSTALYVALKAMGIEPFTEVIVGCLTDPGGMMPIPLLNCIPIIADVAPDSLSPGPEQIEELITPLTSAIVVAHIAGYPADIEGILEVGKRHDIPIIEDCAQAHGAEMSGRFVGTFGKIAAISTMSGKHMNTGSQGGVVFTSDKQLYERSRRASDRGKPFFLPEHSTNEAASLNMNLGDMASAIGRVQIGKLPKLVESRRDIVKKLETSIIDQGLISVSVMSARPGSKPSYWWLPLKVNLQKLSCDRDTFVNAIISEGVPASDLGWGLMPHRMEWFQKRRVFGTSRYPWASPDYTGGGDREFPCPNATALMDGYMKLPVHEGWGDGEVADVLASLSKVEQAFRK